MTSEITEQPKEPEAKTHPKLSLFKAKEEMNFGDHLRNNVLEVLAILFWAHTLTKVFIFDVDSWLLNNFFPDYGWILNFRLIYALALVSILWRWVGTRDTIVWFLYIAFYPLVILFIKLPYFIFKQKSWLLAFAILNTIASFFKNLKYGLTFTTVFLAAFSIIVFSQAIYLLIAAASALITLILIVYVKSFISALKPTVIFQIYSKFFKGVRRVGRTSFELDKEMKNLPIEEMEPKQLEKWSTNLQTSVLFNRFCLFTAKKLRDYQASEWRIIPSILGLLWLIIFTVTSFSGIYYSLFKLDSNLFRFTQEPSLFTFLYFSFNNLVLNSTPEITPGAILSQSVYMLQASLSFLLVLIIATLYIGHRAQRSSSELDEVIVALGIEAKDMEAFIQDEYKIPNIEGAMERLKEIQSGLVQFIYWLSKRI